MATCNIRLYGDTKNSLSADATPFELQLGKNWVVDDLISYLSTKTLVTINNCQYVKKLGNLTMALKLDLPQKILEMGVDGYKYIRYIGMQNSDTSEWIYYFVTDYERISKKCINFILVMDTLNSTLSNVSYKRKLEFTDKTNITREHVDRFYPTPNGITYLRNIPMLPEGINPPLYKTKSIKLDTLQAGEYSKNNWYLVYRTEIEPGETDLTKIGNPIKLYLLNDSSLKILGATQQSTYTLTTEYFTTNKKSYDTLGFSVEDGNNGILTLKGTQVNMGSYAYIYIRLDNTNTFFEVYGAPFRGAQKLLAKGTAGSDNIVFSTIPDTAWTIGKWINTAYDNTTQMYEPSGAEEAIKWINSSKRKLEINISYEIYTKAFKDLDRTDSRLVKIICLPYCPIKYTIVNDQFSFLYPWVYPDDWALVDDMIQIKDINRILEVDLSKVVSDDTANYKELTQKISSNEIQYDTPRFIPESKLYHSEFFQRTYFYDSFVYTVNLERMVVNPDDWREQDLTKTYLTYQMTNGIKSTMMFSFPTPQECEWYESENYSKYLIVNRNNEVSMYDNAYLDYIRNGYNYDVKVKNRNAALSVLSMFTGGASSLISAGLNVGLADSRLVGAKNELLFANRDWNYAKATDEYDSNIDAYFKAIERAGRAVISAEDKLAAATRASRLSSAATIGGLALSTIGNVASGISSMIAQEEQLRQTLKTKAMQASVVENADDLDLLKAYSGNKLSVTTYKVLPEMQKYLSDLFYYTGSKVGYMGVPDTHKRLYFDFIQCDPIFKATYTWDNAVIADVTSKLQQGVTFFHKVNNAFDFEQQYENWELFLIGGDN